MFRLLIAGGLWRRTSFHGVVGVVGVVEKVEEVTKVTRSDRHTVRRTLHRKSVELKRLENYQSAEAAEIGARSAQRFSIASSSFLVVTDRFTVLMLNDISTLPENDERNFQNPLQIFRKRRCAIIGHDSSIPSKVARIFGEETMMLPSEDINKCGCFGASMEANQSPVGGWVAGGVCQ